MPNASGSIREPHPLARHERAGKEREVGPEARRPPSDHKAENPRGRGGSEMHKSLAGLLAGFALLVAAPVASADDVLVRVEGASDTLVPRTGTPIQPGGTFTKDGNAAHQCASGSAGG